MPIRVHRRAAERPSLRPRTIAPTFTWLIGRSATLRNSWRPLDLGPEGRGRSFSVRSYTKV